MLGKTTLAAGCIDQGGLISELDLGGGGVAGETGWRETSIVKVIGLVTCPWPEMEGGVAKEEAKVTLGFLDLMVEDRWLPVAILGK